MICYVHWGKGDYGSGILSADQFTILGTQGLRIMESKQTLLEPKTRVLQASPKILKHQSSTSRYSMNHSRLGTSEGIPRRVCIRTTIVQNNDERVFWQSIAMEYGQRETMSTSPLQTQRKDRHQTPTDKIWRLDYLYLKSVKHRHLWDEWGSTYFRPSRRIVVM